MSKEEWKNSQTDPLWFYKVDDTETYNAKTHPAKETLNAVHFGTQYKIYHTIGSLSNWTLVKIAENKKEALKFMREYMEDN